MPNWLMESVRARARRVRPTLVFPEYDDVRVLRAVSRLVREESARPIFVGERQSIRAAAKQWDVELPAEVLDSTVDPTSDERSERYAELLYELRKEKGMTRDEAAREVARPIVFAALMVRAGDADGCVAGAVLTTAEVVGTALRIVRPAEGVRTVSGAMVVELPRTDVGEDGVFLASDCAVVANPTAEQLVEIAASAADAFFALTGRTPRVAFLSYSTKGSGKGPLVEKVASAAREFRAAHPEIVADGEIQMDAAVNQEVCARKAPGSALAGRANVLIFPDLNAGNIGYKIMQRIGGGEALGPLLLGLSRPMNDLSRGATADEIVRTATAVAALAARG